MKEEFVFFQMTNGGSFVEVMEQVAFSQVMAEYHLVWVSYYTVQLFDSLTQVRGKVVSQNVLVQVSECNVFSQVREQETSVQVREYLLFSQVLERDSFVQVSDYKDWSQLKDLDSLAQVRVCNSGAQGTKICPLVEVTQLCPCYQALDHCIYNIGQV